MTTTGVLERDYTPTATEAYLINSQRHEFIDSLTTNIMKGYNVTQFAIFYKIFHI